MPIRVDLSTISEAIVRCGAGSVGREGAKNGCFIFCVGVVISKIRGIENAEDASYYPGGTTFDIV